jgi:peptidoglycan/LPS O-acetylase OafA/YrhL
MIAGRELSDKSLQIDSLDGLRGLAVLLVFLSHTGLSGMHLLPFANFAGIGRSGVFLFFVLSAFLLTMPFIKRGKTALNRKFLLNYALRRFFRIYPLYFLYLLLGLVTSLWLWKIMDWDHPKGIPFYLTVKDFFQHVFLLKWKGVTWSILVECRYYFVLPLLAFAYSVMLKNKLLPAIVLTVVLFIAIQLYWPLAASPKSGGRLGPYLPIFMMGSLLALIRHLWQEKGLGRIRRYAVASECAGIVAFMVLICMIPSVASYLLGMRVPYNLDHTDFLLYGFLWSLVLFSCLTGAGWIRRFFESPILRYFGFISFSVYLLHAIVLRQMKGIELNKCLLGWIILIITIGISHLSWVLIERPTSKFRLKTGKAKPPTVRRSREPSNAATVVGT